MSMEVEEQGIITRLSLFSSTRSLIDDQWFNLDADLADNQLIVSPTIWHFGRPRTLDFDFH